MAFFSTTSGVAVVDTRTRPGTITLPLTSQIPNRYLQIKDLYGAFGRSSLTLSTQTGESFDDGTTSKVFTDPFTFFTLYAASTTRWAQLGGTQTIQQTVSSLNVSSITIGSGSGWLQLPPIQSVYVSTTIVQGQALYALSSYFGNTSTATALQMWGLQGNYNNTVLAEVSTGVGTQEFLVFKGSSSTDRVRIQTTGNFVVETGVSSRLWDGSTIPTQSNATPAMIINTSSNVGIQTATPGATLDVAGTVRGQILSTQNINLSSINGQLFGQPINSTVIGLGSAGYISTSQLTSTVAGLASGTGSSGFPSTVSTSYGSSFTTLYLNPSTVSYVNVTPSPSNLWVAVGIDFANTNSIKYSLNGRGWINSVSGAFTTSGNDVAFNGSMWVAVGSGGNSNSNIKYSLDGLNWLDSVSGGFFFSGTGVAWNGRMWVATGNDLTAAARVKYSFDGLNWSNSTGSAFTSDGADVAWNGFMWVAVGALSGGNSNETIKYSYDGINWSNSSGIGFNQGGFYAATAVAWNGTIWVALGFDSGNGTIKYSGNGINWSNSLSGGFSSYGEDIAWNGQMWVAVGSGGSSNANIKYSFDGLNWSNSISGGFSSYGSGIAWNGTLWVASGTTSSGSQLKYSTDGMNWIDSFFNTFTNGRGIAFSSNTTPSYGQNNLSILPQNIPLFLRSTNSILAQPSSLIINNTLEVDLVWNRVGINCNIPQYSLDVNGSLNISSLFINTSSFTTILTSTVAGIGSAGLTTANLNSTVIGLGSAGYISTSQLTSTVAGIGSAGLTTANLNSTVIGLGSAGYISTSQLTSTVAGLGTGGYPSTVSTAYGTNFVTSNFTASTVSFLNVAPSTMNRWVAVGQDLTTTTNNILYSDNGISWIAASSGTFASNGFGVAFNGSMWIALGQDSTANGNIKYSFNGVNWSNVTSGGFDTRGKKAAWNGRMWVAVGGDTLSNNTIKYSYNGLTWSNSVGAGFTTQGEGIAWNGFMWVAVGISGLQADTVKYSYDGITWSNGTNGFVPSGYGADVTWAGRFWVAVGADVTPAARIKVSYDGINWINSVSGTFTGSAGGPGGYAVAWNGNLILAGGYDTNGPTATYIKYSYDGLNWSNSTSNAFVGSGAYSIAWNGSLWVAGGSGGGPGFSNLHIEYSSDGLTWSNSSSGGAQFRTNCQDVAFSSNTTPSYRQSGLAIMPAQIPLSLNSTNQIMLQVSSLLINDTLEVDRVWNRVGINCNIPQYSLDVNGSLNLSSLFINTSSFTTILTSTVAGIGSGSGLTAGNLTSTVIGLGTIGYISTSQLVSTVAGIGSGGGGGGITTGNLNSTVVGLGTVGYISTQTQSQYSYFTVRSGTSYTGEPWTEQVMSLSNLGLFNAPLDFEVGNTVLRVSTNTNLTMRVNYMTGGNNDTLTVPRPTITMVLSTPTGSTTFPSVENFEGGGGTVTFLQDFDSNSRVYFNMRGLSNYTFGTLDTSLYRMSFEMVGNTTVLNVLSNISSLSSIIDNLYTKNTRVTNELFVDLSTISRTVETHYLRVWDQAIIGSNSVTIQNDTVIASNVQVSSLNILDQSTLRYVPLSISSGSIYLNNTLASAAGGGGGGTLTGGSTLSSLFVGSSSNQNFIKFWGSIGEYNNTAIVQQSTGGGTNEFLFFEGSSINDQFRFQTTGNIRFETGVGAPRDVNTATQLATPSMIINSSSNVGILTNNPTFNLDVAGTGRFQTLLSTTSLYSGALYLGVFFG